MKRPPVLIIGLLSLTALLGAPVDLRRAFENPPDDSRIMMRWWWFGAGVTKPELEREMRAMKAGGIGGFEVQPVYPLALDDPEYGFRNLPYLSPEYLDTLAFVAAKARELGLRMDVTLGSGWPFGGPHTPVTEAAGSLRCERLPVSAVDRSLPLPDIGAGEKLLAIFLASGDTKKFSAGPMTRLTNIERGRVILPIGINGPNVALFFVASRTGQMVKRAAVGAEGFVLDHYDRAAIDHHLTGVGGPLLAALKLNPPYAVFSDSLEVFASDWTSDLPAQFQARRGYDLAPYLPALAGDIGEKTGAIRNDWGKTLTELCNERYLTPIREWAAQHGTRFRSQTYGTPPVTLSSNSLVDLPEGEGARWRRVTASRWASSASHLYGRPVTSAETWTWLHSPAFRATPLDMKAEADLQFLQGINQLVGHGWPYSPEMAGEPGWRFYAAAVFNNHNPWWIVMPGMARYLQRVSFLLRQGKPVHDVALYVPTADARARFTLGHVSIDRSLDAILGPNVIPQILDAGYNFDFIDDEAIERVGIPHRALILPAVERIPLASYRKIEEYANRGGVVVATHRLPSEAPGLMEAASDAPQIREISRRLAGRLLADDAALGQNLNRLVPPDLAADPPVSGLGFVHRKVEGVDIYFIANTNNHAVHTRARFGSSNGDFEFWNAFTAANTPGTAALDLEPYESRVAVFTGRRLAPRAPNSAQPDTIDISADWNVRFASLNRAVRMPQLRSWADDEATRFYSGVAEYTKEITIPESLVRQDREIVMNFGEGTAVEPHPLANGVRAWLEGPVREAALVYVNGQLAGSVWRPPYEIPVTGQLRAGANQIRVVVANTAINALAGQTLPDYRLLNLRYGERFQAQDMSDLKPLPSGLLGPIRLIAR